MTSTRKECPWLDAFHTSLLNNGEEMRHIERLVDIRQHFPLSIWEVRWFLKLSQRACDHECRHVLLHAGGKALYDLIAIHSGHNQICDNAMRPPIEVQF